MEASTASTAAFRDLLSLALADVLPQDPAPQEKTADLQVEVIVTAEQGPEQQHSGSLDFNAVHIQHIKQYAAHAAAAAEAKQRLQQAMQKARQKEMELLADADAAYTPAWRMAGLPARASQLRLDPDWLLGSKLLDPAAIMMKQQAQQQKEVLQPPTAFKYCSKDGDPHYLQETSNLKVRHTITQRRLAAARVQQAASTPQNNHPHPSAPAGQSAAADMKSRCCLLKAGGLRRQSSHITGISSCGTAKAKTGSKSVPWSQLPLEEVTRKMAAAAARYKAMGAVMTPEQMEVEEQIIKSMFHRLSYLRNPRYPAPPAAAAAKAAMMQGSLTGTRKGHRQNRQLNTSSPNRCRNPPGADGAVQRAAGVHLQSSLEAGFTVFPPAGVLFEAYEPGEVYFQTVQLQNVSSVLKGLRLLPPASRFFQISLPRFPSAANELAPGISTELSVCFTPDSLGDYQDCFIVETMSGQFQVPLRASRPHPLLTLPEVLQVGHVLVGNSRSREIEFANNGGAGCFMLLTANEWAAAAEQHKQHEQQQQQQKMQSRSHLKSPASSIIQCPDAFTKTAAAAAADAAGQGAVAAVAVSGAFGIAPTYLDMPAGSVGKFTVNFTPQAAGSFQGDFVLVYDNCTVRQLSVQGNGAQVQCQLLQLDGRDLFENETDAPLWFGQVHPGCCCSRTIKVQNLTKLPFPYKWQVDHHQQQESNVLHRQQQQQQQQAFTVQPSVGAIPAEGEVSFIIKYSPPCVGEHAAAAVLLVERSGDTLLKTISTGPVATSSSSASKLTNARHKPSGRLPQSTAGTSVSTAPRTQQQQQEYEQQMQEQQQQQEYEQQMQEQGRSEGDGWDAVVLLELEGRGVPIMLRADPGAVVSLPGHLTVGESGEQQLVILNDTPAPAHIEVKTEEELLPTTNSSTTITTSSSSSKIQPSCSEQHLGSAASKTVAAIMVDPHTATIPPYSSTPLTVKFLALAAGVHTGNLVVNVRHGQAVKIATRAAVQEACVVPAVPQMDFGIISIGHVSTQQLKLVNRAAHCKAHWAIQQLEIELTCPQLLLCCEPSSGTLDPSGCRSTAVTVTGSCEGTHRLLLQVSSSSSSSDGSWHTEQLLTQRQYVEVLVTVGVPRVVLDTYKIHLSPAYLGVQQQQTVTLSNTSRLPLHFSWMVEQVQQQQRSSAQQSGPIDCADGTSSKGILLQDDLIYSSPGSQQQEMLCSGQLGLSITPASGQLDPGQQLQLQLLLDPLAVGPVQLLCSCSVSGMTMLAGMVITALITGLQVAYAVERPLHPSLAAAISSMTTGSKQLAWQQQQQQLHVAAQEGGMDTAAAAQAQGAALVADFGVVALHEVAELVLRVVNQTSMTTSVKAWVSRFPAAAAAAAGGAGGSSEGISVLHSLGQAIHPTPLLDKIHMQAAAPSIVYLQSSTGLLQESVAADARVSAAAHGGGAASSRLPASAAPAAPTAAGSGATAVRAVQSSLAGSSTGQQQVVNAKQESQGQHRTASSLHIRQQQQQQGKRTGSPTSWQQQQQLGLASKLAQTLSGSGVTGLMSTATGKPQGPFRAPAGNTMMTARLVAAAASAALGSGCSGCAVAVEPESIELQGWGEVQIRMLAYNNLPGTYMDHLNVQVGDLPIRSIPLRLQVAGSPVVLSRERVLLQGLQQLQHVQQPMAPTLPYALLSASGALAAANGHAEAEDAAAAASATADDTATGAALTLALGVVPAGVRYKRTFYAVNTSALPMHLVWDYQTEVDAATAGAAAASASDAAASSTDIPASEIQEKFRAAAALPASETGGKDADSEAVTAGPSEFTCEGITQAEVVNVSRAARSSSSSRAAVGVGKRPGSPAVAATHSVTAASKAKGRPAASAACGGGTATDAGTGKAEKLSSAGGAAATATAARRMSSASSTSAAAVPSGENAGVTNQQPTVVLQQQGDDVQVALEGHSSPDLQHDNTADEQQQHNAPLLEGEPNSLLEILQVMAEKRKQALMQQQQESIAQAAKVPAAPYSNAFTVSPLECIMAPHQQQKFTVSFTSDSCRLHTVKLVGRQVFAQHHDDAAVSLSLWPQRGSAAAAGSVKAVISGGFHACAAPPPRPIPALLVTLSATAVPARLTPDEPDRLNWSVWSTHEPASHTSYKHMVTLCNTAGCPLVFQLATEGPFELVSVVPSVVQDPVGYRGMKGTDAFAKSIQQPSGIAGSSGNRLPGDMVMLPPGESVDATILLKPPAKALAASAVLQDPSGSDHLNHPAAAVAAAVEQSKVALLGALVVSAANGQQQRLALSAEVLHPVITASARILSFGSIHPSAPRPLHLLLTNPTTVDARWRAEVVLQQQTLADPGQQQQQPRQQATPAVGSLFTVTPDRGVLSGRGLGMPKTQQLVVTFAPDGYAYAAAELRVLVDGGSGCLVRLQGQGTFDETKEHLAVLKEL